MSIENERKYVLTLDFKDAWNAAEIKWNNEVRHYHSYYMQQGYLHAEKGMTTRVRKSEECCLFCYKKMIPETNFVVEIEKEITEKDFNYLWTETFQKLRKIRHYVYVSVPFDTWKDSDGELHSNRWEIDFFTDDLDETYFVLAEYEMPEGQLNPDFIPDQIKEYILYEVPKNLQYEFSSLRLADRDYATSLLDKLTK